MKKLLYVFVAALLLTACKEEKEILKVSVSASDIGTQQMTVVYTTPDGNRASFSLPAVNGAFDFEIDAPAPSVIEIFSASNKALFAPLIGENGESITLRRVDGALKAEDSSRSQQLIDYKEGDSISGFSPEVRDAIRIVRLKASRTDWPRFTSPELVIAKDSVLTPEAEGLWVFTSTDFQRTSMLLDSLRAYADRKSPPLRDVFVGTDLAMWRMAVQRDSATWLQALSPDAPLVLSGILTSTPMLVEVDSAGTVLRTQLLE